MANAEKLALNASRLVTLPEVYLRARRALQSDVASLAEVADIIACDPGMTTRLLRIANSAFFGFTTKVQTVARAINILGTQQVHDLLLATSVSEAFAGVSEDLVDVRDFWLRSVSCGSASRLLAARCNVLDSERLFVEGLLHDIGHLVMYQQIPEEAGEALRLARETQRPLYRLERERLNCDYTEVGAELLRIWQMPPSLQESVRRHIEPERAVEFPLEAGIVHIAWRLTEAGGDAEAAAALVSPAAWQTTGLGADCLDAIAAETLRCGKEVAELICPPRRRAA